MQQRQKETAQLNLRTPYETTRAIGVRFGRKASEEVSKAEEGERIQEEEEEAGEGNSTREGC